MPTTRRQRRRRPVERLRLLNNFYNDHETNEELHSRIRIRGEGGGTPILRQYGYVPPESLHFSAWAAPKDATFSTWTAPKEPPPPRPFQKHTFVPLFRPGLIQKTPLLKVYVSLLFLVPKSPSFFSEGPLLKPPFSVRGRSLSPPFSISGQHIYTSFIYEYPLPQDQNIL